MCACVKKGKSVSWNAPFVTYNIKKVLKCENWASIKVRL